MFSYLKTNLRTCHIIEPDYKHITIGLLSSHGLNQGYNRIEVLAGKIIDFLEQLPLVVSNFSFFFQKNLIRT